MAVPKKRMSKSKSNHRKNLWRKNLFKIHKNFKSFLNFKKKSIMLQKKG